MLPPPRDRLDALTAAARAVAPTGALGFSRVRADGRLLIHYSYIYGIGAFVLDAGDCPSALVPSADVGRTGPADLDARRDGVMEWVLSIGDVRQVVSFPLSPADSPATFWIGLTDEDDLSPERLARLNAVAQSAEAVLARPAAPGEAGALLERLEKASALLPALLQVLDVREVFDRVSSLAKEALPHDLLLLRLFNETTTQITTYAGTAARSFVGAPQAGPYPAPVARAWDFDIIDDHQLHKIEHDKPPAAMGARASIRLPIRFDGKVIGGIGFMSTTPAVYGTSDVAVARRLADYVSMALSHHRLAEQLADQARQAEELRARSTNLDLLDDLLGALIDSGGLSNVFAHVSAIAGKVIAHDAAALLVRFGDGTRAHVYASAGYPRPAGDIADVPEELIRNPEFEFQIFDPAERTTPEYGRTAAVYARIADLGFRTFMRVPIKLDGKPAGALVFLTKTPKGFLPHDASVARRLADRMALTLTREREVEASKRADEATERAAKLEARVRALTEELDSRTGYRRVIGESKEWRQVLTQSTQVASTEATVLLLGESGTGKEVVARFLHRASQRGSGPFVALNCAALPEQLLEAELFGYERGAFTGATQSKPGQLEQAAGGTLFLDEVGEMSPPAQAKFLRVLQEREFQRLGGTRVLRTDARIIAATNRDLPRAIQNGQFREDLFYRLNVFAIRLPALRERRDDVLPLSEAFLNEIGKGLGRPPGGVTREARELLLQYTWPGNVRELRNMLERAAILCDGGLITPEHLAISLAAPGAPHVRPVEAAVATAASAPASTALPSSAGDLNAIERAMIEQALQSARFNKSKAAKALGMTRHQLYIRMKKHGFE
jgi:transcriptional regulator with GAF, ATPase, and Fis domain